MSPVNAVTVYLDQSDWSYLQAGADPDADHLLRTLGAQGRAVFVVSFHHFEEVGALEDPLSRAQFLRAYPGTALTHVTSQDLHLFEIEKMLTGMSMSAGRTIDIEPLAQVSDDNLRKLATAFTKWHPIRKQLEPLHRRRRELFLLDREALRANGGKSTRRDELGIWKAQIRGDMPDMLRIWERTMRRPPTDEELAKIQRRVAEIASWYSELEKAGLAPPADLDFDDVFPRLIFIWLPPEVKRHRPSVELVLRSWRSLRQTASPLACSAAILEATLANPAKAYESSEEVDIEHAAFAPAVDVFTADKRTADSLRRLPLKCRLIRSNRLSEVGSALTELAASP